MSDNRWLDVFLAASNFGKALYNPSPGYDPAEVVNELSGAVKNIETEARLATWEHVLSELTRDYDYDYLLHIAEENVKLLKEKLNERK